MLLVEKTTLKISVNAVVTNANVTIEGAPFKPKAVMKTMAPNKDYLLEMVIEGMGTVMKQKFDGTVGYQRTTRPMKVPMTEDQIAGKTI